MLQRLPQCSSVCLKPVEPAHGTSLLHAGVLRGEDRDVDTPRFGLLFHCGHPRNAAMQV